jgi:hypothetical protein
VTRWKHEDWLNGYYEILMDFDDPYAWIEAAQTLWSQPQLLGVWTSQEFDADSDPRLDASDVLVACELMTGHLNGVARLPNGKTAPCGSGISQTENWLVFFLPLAGLGRCYELGRFPFGDAGRPWVFEVDQWMVSLATAVFRKIPFRVAAVGSELHTLDMISQAGAGVPERRPCGLLAPACQDLQWFPPTFKPEAT